MPRITKEQKEVENVKEEKAKKASTAKKTSSSKKTATKKVSVTTTKKTSTNKKAATVDKKETTKKAPVKKSPSKEKESSKKTNAKKQAVKKASNTTKKSSKTTSKKTTKTAKSKKLETDKKVDIVEYYDLPYRYNQTVVKILAQTPNTLFIYWDISDTDRENFKKQYGDNFFDKTQPILILHNDTKKYSFEVEINDFANSWYLQVNDTDCTYRVELARKPIYEYTKNEPSPLPDYLYITTSNSLISPNDHILFTTEDFLIRNIKTNKYYQKSLKQLKTKNSMEKIYNIHNLYKKLYQEESSLYDLSNPSSGNPSSGNFRIGKF